MKTTIPSDVWETKRSQISALYTEEEWPLKQVMKKIRTDDFNPTETQLRSRLKKWGVTKPSRQRRKRPVPRAADCGSASLLQAPEIELRSRINEQYIPQFVGYPTACGASINPGNWDSQVRWIVAPSQDHSQMSKIITCNEGHRESAASIVSTSDVSSPSTTTTAYLHRQHRDSQSFDRHYATASRFQETSTSSSDNCPMTVFTSIDPNLTTSSGNVTPTSDVAGLPAEWQSPDSTHHAARTPGSTLPSPAVQPTSPWNNYPTPDMCKQCSPTIYPLDDPALEHQVNFVKEYLEGDDGLSYPSLLDFPLNDSDIFDSHSLKTWKRPCSSSGLNAEFPRSGDFCSSKERQIGKAKSNGSAGFCNGATSPSNVTGINRTLPYQKLDASAPLDISVLGGPSSISLTGHHAYHSDALSGEYLLSSSILS